MLFFFGLINQTIECEVHDRTTLVLPPIQLDLIQKLEKVVRSPLDLVIMSGGGLDLSYVRDSNQCGSLISMDYAKQSGGLALANVMFGQYNPSRRLPMTYYSASYIDGLSMFDI